MLQMLRSKGHKVKEQIYSSQVERVSKYLLFDKCLVTTNQEHVWALLTGIQP